MSIKGARVLVTGATGFVGKHLCQHLLAKGCKVRAVGRHSTLNISHPALEYCMIESIDGQTQWNSRLKEVDIVVHLAARVHQMKERGMQSLGQYQEINVRGTRQLAKAAIENDVKRFIYLSTVKVNGEKTIDMPFRAEEQPRPQDAYSLSKLQGEQILQEEARRSGMEWVIIRPTLIYGAFVAGNFRRLVNLAKRCYPLPFRWIKNKRSLVSVYNLCHFIECCLTHPNAQREIFLVSDDDDVSTPKLIKIIRNAQNRRSGLFPFPLSILKLFSALCFRLNQMARLTESLQVNIEKTKRLLQWTPPYNVAASIKLMLEQESEIASEQESIPLNPGSRLEV